jgi:hypothetical protein
VQGVDARFNCPDGLALDAEENLLVADYGNNAIRHVTMAGVVGTVTDNGEEGFDDDVGAVAHFNRTCDVVVDGEGVIVVADTYNHRLRKIVGGQVTTLAGSSEQNTTDGAGAVRDSSSLKTADLLRLEALLEHCVEAFRRGLKVDTAVEALVWAHLFGPAEAHTAATEYFVLDDRCIKV